MAVTAAVTETAGGPFVLSEVELGELRPDEVLVHNAAAGICHTDLICRDQWLPVPLPAVLGHEGAGVVFAVGAGVTKVAV
ncbi:MAG TPA: alcohol dehydrogenase catalytic domain-containing protein, partial [Steroidobacteraceae bacterium]|nr:alcohol dehydrogenase catalytic domain-containing protein [Steroidobacteraceae bacterium]